MLILCKVGKHWLNLHILRKHLCHFYAKFVSIGQIYTYCISWGVAKCVHEIGRNQKIKSPHFRFKWCFLCSGGLNMMILDQIIQKKTKTTTKQPKTSTHCFWFLWTGQGTFLVQDFHRPNGAKILRFGNFPETLTYLGSLENCQKSKSFSKIWLWKSWNFGYFLDRTRKPPHFQYFQ